MTSQSEQTTNKSHPHHDDSGDGEQWSSSLERTVDHLFLPYRNASSYPEQKKALENIARSLVEEKRTLSNPGSVSMQSTNLPILLEEMARSCIIRIPIVDGGDVHGMIASIDNVLDACGIIPSLSACVACLKELASLNKTIVIDNDDDKDDSDGNIDTISATSRSIQNRILKTSLHTIRRLLCTRMIDFSKPDPDQDEHSSWWICEDNASNELISSDQQRIPSATSANTLMIDRFVENIVLLLPQLIANACHSLQVNLPSWAVTTRFYPRIVECGICNMLRGTSYNHVAKKEVDNSNTEYCNTESTRKIVEPSSKAQVNYVSALIRQLVRRRKSDSVAAGIYGYCLKPPDKLHHIDETARGMGHGVYSQHEKHVEIESLSNLLRDTMSSESSREASTLIRSLIQYALQPSTVPPSASTTSTAMEALMRALCVPLLDNSWDVQETFLRLIAFSSSSMQPGPASVDRRVCRKTMDLLSQCCRLSVSNNKTNRSDDDNQNDDGISIGSNSSGSSDSDDAEEGDLLHRHVRILLESWSQTTFVQRTDRRLQHHVTTLLRSGLSILFSKNRNDQVGNNEDGCGSPRLSAVHSLTLSILEGVTCRLESSLEDIRRDGMKVASDLARFMEEDLVFDEIQECNDSDSENDLEVREDSDTCAVEPEKSSKGQESRVVRKSDIPVGHEGVSKTTEIDRLPKKAKTKKAKPTRILDPDAEYLSDDYDSSDDEVETDKDEEADNVSYEHDDSTFWEGEDDLVPFDLDDDEEDLRETGRPLSLRECLQLLRAVETEETAYSQHETGLQEVSKLVRSRPDDLPDIAVSLATQLLRLENKFNIEGFSKMRQDGLTSLLVHEPLSVGQQLIVEVFEDGGLSDRLNVLAALNEAASELCGRNALEGFEDGIERR